MSQAELTNEDKFHNELQAFYASFFNINETQTLLYHYTDYDGLLGIFESKQIWLTDYRFLNDSSEIQFSSEVITPSIINSLGTLTNFDSESLESMRHAIITHLYKQYNIYVFSMCVRENYLPAWRWYARDATGFSIGFNFRNQSLLPPNFHIENNFLISSALVHYKTEIFNKYIKELFQHTNKLISQYHISSKYASTGLLCYVLPVLPLLKHYAYEEEKEYRILLLEEFFDFTSDHMRVPDDMKLWSKSKESNTKFASTIPRVKIDINPLSISEIWVGPKLNFDHASHELNLQLSKFGFSNIQIKKSNIPYR